MREAVRRTESVMDAAIELPQHYIEIESPSFSAPCAA